MFKIKGLGEYIPAWNSTVDTAKGHIPACKTKSQHDDNLPVSYPKQPLGMQQHFKLQLPEVLFSLAYFLVIIYFRPTK